MNAFERSFLDAALSVEEQNVVTRFYHGYQDAPVTIAFRMAHMAWDSNGAVNFMPIVTHEERRVVMKPGEIMKMFAKHPDEKKQHLSNMILLLGTPYGVVVVHGRAKDYRVTGKNIVKGPMPHLHTTANFTKMAIRVFKRKNMKFLGEVSVMVWIFSPTFEQDVLDQVELDKAAECQMSFDHHKATGKAMSFEGYHVSDGLPKRRIAKHPAAKTQPVLTSHDVKGKAKPTSHPTKAKAKVATAPAPKPTPKPGQHPLDILPCRANGFKGKRFVDQTPEEKAAGKAMLANPEEVLAGQPA